MYTLAAQLPIVNPALLVLIAIGLVVALLRLARWFIAVLEYLLRTALGGLLATLVVLGILVTTIVLMLTNA